MQDVFSELSGRLLPWYDRAARDLPWRADREPYHVLLSEIMLQQTRVEAVRAYYQRFLSAFPTISALAAAPEEQVQKLWEGLGYYSRARNLQKTAKILALQGGAFPDTPEELQKLPGIGPYTAGAIASICFERPTPALDGNVLRICARLTACRERIDTPQVKKAFTRALERVYPAGACGKFTQSLMELGALICIPNGAPDCKSCPVADLCEANRQNLTALIPVKAPKKEKRREELTVFLLRCDGRIALRRRQDTGLLAGLWELPHADGFLSAQEALEQVERFGLHARELEFEVEKKHIFTHIIWQMRCFSLKVSDLGGNFTWADEQELQSQYALPTAFRQFLEKQ